MRNITPLAIITILTMTLFGTVNFMVAKSPKQINQKQAATLALQWILSQKNSATNLINSYEDNQNIGYLYDQAIASIAFTSKGKINEAKNILKALQKYQLQEQDANAGAWCTALQTTDGRCLEFQYPVGPVLWIILAVGYYHQITGDNTYNNMVKKALDYTLQFQQPDGGINLGPNQTGAGTEHNLDAYAALSYWHQVFPKAGYNKQAQKVKQFLVAQTWRTSEKRFAGGRDDLRDPLDVNTWGVLALGKDYKQALEYVEKTHSVTLKFNSKKINGYDFDGKYFAQGAPNDIWLEGTAQMAVAYHWLEKKEKSDKITQEIIKTQGSNGGIPYSINGSYNGYWNMSKAHSVAATGWLILAIEGVNPLKY